jgi:hypothetical protein
MVVMLTSLGGICPGVDIRKHIGGTDPLNPGPGDVYDGIAPVPLPEG